MHDPRVTQRPRQRRRRGSFPRAGSLVAAVCCFFLLLVLVLAVRVRSMVGPLGIDEWFAQHLVGRLSGGGGLAGAGYNWIARVVAPGLVGVMTTIALLWAARRRDLNAGLLAVVGPGFAFVLVDLVIKPLVGRRMLPTDRTFIFPSGTVSVVAASFAADVILVCRWAGRARATQSAAALGVVALLVCVAVVELDWHYATDVIGGLAVGGAAVLAVAGLLAAFERRIAVRGLTKAHTRA